MQLLDGKKVSQEIYQKLHDEVALLKAKNIHPRLTIVLVGNDPASLSYIKQKRKASEIIGIEDDFIQLDPEKTTTGSLIELVQKLNNDSKIHGILVQLPLPKHIDEDKIIMAIDPVKDVDGFTAVNVGKMFLGKAFEELLPATPLGIIKLLEHYKINPEGKEVVIVGSSNIVGKPVAVMMMNRRATVTVCNSKTPDLAAQTRRADILIVAVGKAGLISAEMVKEGVVVLDVGTNRTADGKLVGDIDFENVSKKAAYVSPVPGGCGPMTVAGLMENMVYALRRQQ